PEREGRGVRRRHGHHVSPRPPEGGVGEARPRRRRPPRPNEGMSVKGATIEKVFQNAEFKADFRCFMHPWMVAYVHVMDHPFYAVTGPDGAFTLKGLPPGEYEITTLHESSRFEASGPVSVKVAAGESKKVEFTYKDAQ